MKLSNNTDQQQEIIYRMLDDKKIRVNITRESFWYFFHFYYAHYLKYATADFQKEIISLIESDSMEDLFIVAFRGSGKSTIVTTAYPIWSILGKQQKKFCTIFCQTKLQAKQHMANIKSELESNNLLKRDLGPFQEESDEWGAYSLVFNNQQARIMVASSEQSIRGLRHNQHRPDLIICDDVEDVQSTKTREGRDKTHSWLYGEVIPTGDKNTRLIIVGNLLHEDSLLMRIKEDIQDKKTKGLFKEYPLIDKNDKCLWGGKYKDLSDLENEKLKVASEISWQREYLLRIIPNEDQVIYPEWIHYYDKDLNKDHVAYRGYYAGVDLAISTKDSADYTTIVSAYIYGRADKLRVHILPNPVELKLNFPDQVKLLKDISQTYMIGQDDTMFIESVAYQEALPQMLESEGVEAESIKPKGDKRTRLLFTSTAIKSGIVKFPKKGCEKLIRQLVGFGVEKHDDLADAFSLLINATLAKHAEDEISCIVALADITSPYVGDANYPDYIDID